MHAAAVAAAAAVTLPTAPGPTALPIIGALPTVGLGKVVPALAPPPHRRLVTLAQTHGDVMTVQFGRAPWVVLSSPEAVHEAFVTKGGDFAGRPMVPSMSLSAGGGDAGFARPVPNRELRELRRAAYSALFSEAAVAAKALEFEDEAERLAEHLLANGGELRTSLRRFASNAVLRFAFSARVPYSTEAAPAAAAEHVELLRLVDAIWAELTATPTTLLDLLGAPADAPLLRGPLRDLVGARDTLLRKLIAERRGGGGGGGGDMLDVLLASQLPSEDVQYTLVDLFVAGVNTVSTALEWELLLTAANPLVQSRARSDAAAAGGGGAYVHALTREVLRAKPPLLLPRMAVRDTSVGGFRVARGQVVYANNWALAHSPAHWREPAAFRPERWLDEESELGSGAEACKFIPFSVGQRACPGARLAEAEIDAASRTLLRSLRWSAAAPPLDLTEEYGLTLAPAVPQRLRFARAAAAKSSRGGRVEMRAPSRATRRQRMGAEEAAAIGDERLRAAGTDRRGGWRASKAKGNRRNRRYENRLLSGVAESWSDAVDAKDFDE